MFDWPEMKKLIVLQSNIIIYASKNIPHLPNLLFVVPADIPQTWLRCESHLMTDRLWQFLKAQMNVLFFQPSVQIQRQSGNYTKHVHAKLGFNLRILVTFSGKVFNYSFIIIVAESFSIQEVDLHPASLSLWVKGPFMFLCTCSMLTFKLFTLERTLCGFCFHFLSLIGLYVCNGWRWEKTCRLSSEDGKLHLEQFLKMYDSSDDHHSYQIPTENPQGSFQFQTNRKVR